MGLKEEIINSVMMGSLVHLKHQQSDYLDLKVLVTNQTSLAWTFIISFWKTFTKQWFLIFFYYDHLVQEDTVINLDSLA